MEDQRVDESADPQGHTENGLYCFLNPERPCSGECMAFTVTESESPTLGAQQKNCSVIVSVERLGRFAGGIMQILKKGQADTARANVQSPPDPMGRR